MPNRNRLVLILWISFLVFGCSLEVQLSAQHSGLANKMVGVERCAQCHVEEFNAWKASPHKKKASKLLDHPKAAGFAKAIGVTDVKTASACTQCHGTQQFEQNGGQVVHKVLDGVSCEKCHGGAGGENGWLQKHYDFGLGRAVDESTKMSDLVADRLKETRAHREKRDQACAQAGMNRSEDVIALVKNCLNCHLVPNENLVKAGHPVSKTFELVQWSGGVVRHNFLLDPKTNHEAPTNWIDQLRNGKGRTVAGRKRLLFIGGKLADLEMSLRIRATVTSTKRASLGDLANDRILDVKSCLAELKIPELNPILEILKSVDKKSLRELTDGDKANYLSVADQVEAKAKQFVKNNEGGKQLSADIKIKSRVKGRPYQSSSSQNSSPGQSSAGKIGGS